jgi:ubiquinone biosynthesis protein COQ9
MTDPDSWAQAAEQRVLDEALARAPATGWTPATLRAAGRAAGLGDADVELLMPNGPADLAALLSRRHDAAALAVLAETDPHSLKIRERIRRAVSARLDAAAKDAPAVRRWAGYLALPMNLALGLRLLWESADALWRWAGDAATDENHYSKRAILSGILAGGLAIRLQSGADAADAFVDARIDNVMAYEKWKAGLAPVSLLRDVASALGRLRYG